MIKIIQGTVWDTLLYYFFHVLGFVSVLLFNVWYGKKRNIPINKIIIVTFVIYGITYLWIHILFWIETGFKNFGGQNIVRGFVYIPLIAYPVSLILKLKWKSICDFMTPCVCLCQAVSHIGCIFTGCCAGYPCDWGIYCDRYDQLAFPVQLFESLTAFLIFMILVYWNKKKQYIDDGKSYPVMLMLFGSTRFLWEFARNNKKIWLGCSSLSFHALFMAIVGVIAMVWITYKSKTKAKGEN